MNDDDRFDDLLQEAAREHNRAPETPRAEMWGAIAAARGAKSAGPSGATAAPTTATHPEVRIIPLYRRHRRALGWVAGLAATLLVGVVIGRMSSPSVSPDRRPATAADGAAATSAAATPQQTVAATDAPGPGGPVIPSPVRPSAVTAAGDLLAVRPNANDRGADRLASGAGSRMTGPTRSLLAAREGSREAALPYRLAAMQHLVTTEALLVTLGSDVRAGRKDTTIAVWAGDLLSTTRVLIDSPAGRDPQLKQLLEDLELVLAQISRLPGARGEAADLGLIDDAVRHREIMTRLRALSPTT